jgi:hypothetical protein
VIVRRLSLALVLMLSACAVPIARFTAIGDPAGGAGDAIPAAPVHGESCRWWILGATLGLPSIEEAVADAVARAGTSGVLRDVELVSLHPVWGPAGRHCYVISGIPSDSGTPR